MDIDGDLELDTVWLDIKAAFGLEEFKDCVLSNLSLSTIQYLQREKLCAGVLAYLQAEMEKRLRLNVAPKFWEHFKKPLTEEDDNDAAKRFQSAVNEIFVATAALQPMVTKMDLLAQQCQHKPDLFGQRSYMDLYWLLLKGSLYSQIPKSDYRRPIKAFYGRAFHVFHVRRERDNDNPNSSMEQDDDENDENIQCEGT